MNMFRMTQGLKGFLIGAAAVGFPVGVGTALFGGRPDAWDLLFLLVVTTGGGLAAGVWGLRKGPLDAGRASSMGGFAWAAAFLVFCMTMLATHPGAAIGIWALFALPFAAFGILMGHLVFFVLSPCIRKL